MKSHELAKILLEKPNLPVIVFDGRSLLYTGGNTEASRVRLGKWKFSDYSGNIGDGEYGSFREAISIE
jgi:hypothetical protein